MLKIGKLEREEYVSVRRATRHKPSLPTIYSVANHAYHYQGLPIQPH
jgi:hypothetical protein